MYISILDYSNGTVSIIDDADNETKDRDTEEVYALLHELGYRDTQIHFMITNEDPLTPCADYPTLDELRHAADAGNRQKGKEAQHG